MRKETEKLIYSLQSGLCASRGSIDEAYKELQEIIKDELPPEVKGVVHLYVQILLNSIVAEVMATEHKPLTNEEHYREYLRNFDVPKERDEYVSKDEHVPASILSATHKELRSIVTSDSHTLSYKLQCTKELEKRYGKEWAAPWADAERSGL